MKKKRSTQNQLINVRNNHNLPDHTTNPTREHISLLVGILYSDMIVYQGYEFIKIAEIF